MPLLDGLDLEEGVSPPLGIAVQRGEQPPSHPGAVQPRPDAHDVNFHGFGGGLLQRGEARRLAVLHCRPEGQPPADPDILRRAVRQAEPLGQAGQHRCRGGLLFPRILHRAHAYRRPRPGAVFLKGVPVQPEGEPIVGLPLHLPDTLLAAALPEAQLFRQGGHAHIARPGLGVQLGIAPVQVVAEEGRQRLGTPAAVPVGRFADIQPHRPAGLLALLLRLRGLLQPIAVPVDAVAVYRAQVHAVPGVDLQAAAAIRLGLDQPLQLFFAVGLRVKGFELLLHLPGGVPQRPLGLGGVPADLVADVALLHVPQDDVLVLEFHA